MVEAYVTGANGFIGKHLMQALGTGARAVPHQELGFFYPEPCRRVFFLSTYGNMHFHGDANAIISANCTDLARLVKRLDWSALEAFVFVSTSSVLLPVQTAYSQAKLAAETFLLTLPNFPARIVRPFTVTGVGDRPEHLIPRLIESCMKSKLISFYPNAEHDYVDVQDVVRGLLRAAEEKRCGPFELGTGLSTSNLQILDLVERTCRKKATLELIQSGRAYDMIGWKSSGTKAWPKSWVPMKGLATSIREMQESYERA